MKTIGMIGGMSWESSIEYYRIINEAPRDKLGGQHSAKSNMYSVEFAEIEVLQHADRGCNKKQGHAQGRISGKTGRQLGPVV